MAADLLTIILREIEARRTELRPSLQEYEQLLLAADALDGEGTVSRSDGAPDERPSSARAAARRAGRPSTKAKRPSPRGPRSGVRSSAATTKAARAPRGAAREAILAALGHGSHTVGELVVVTAMSAPNVNGNLRRLVAEGAITKARREGKTAYALSSPAD